MRKRFASMFDMDTYCPHLVNAMGGGGGGGGKGGGGGYEPPPLPPPVEKPVAAKPVAEVATAARQAQREKASKAAGIKGSILTNAPLADGKPSGKSLLGQ